MGNAHLDEAKIKLLTIILGKSHQVYSSRLLPTALRKRNLNVFSQGNDYFDRISNQSFR
ncbi:hypothetical protein PCC8801_2783 [Rippkaea orientalis PCC 8801]|uniref:Uncharacterized protein n=1 Tax=Rippkaea orientalis (strain PCC 8801 / RF-1) TaxID=41431 RepID=B7K5Q1_RIPO1|nr:hypothetical protein PCC8801_2783 [Rippkaea orientalis PCC 8801]